MSNKERTQDERILAQLVGEKRREVKSLAYAGEAIKLAIDSVKLAREFLDTDLANVSFTKLTVKREPSEMLSTVMPTLSGFDVAIAFELDRERKALASMEAASKEQATTEKALSGKVDETESTHRNDLIDRPNGTCMPMDINYLWCGYCQVYEYLAITEGLRQVISRSGESPIQYFADTNFCITAELLLDAREQALDKEALETEPVYE